MSYLTSSLPIEYSDFANVKLICGSKNKKQKTLVKIAASKLQTAINICSSSMQVLYNCKTAASACLIR